MDSSVFTGDTNATAYYLPVVESNWGTSLGGIPTVAETPQSQFTSVVNQGGATITSYNGSNATVIIPAVLNEEPVAAIGADVFAGKTNITNILIPSSINNISTAAFATCNGLTNIVIPNSVTAIAPEAFQGCTNLTSVTVPGSITEFSQVFYQCTKLTNAIIDNGD